MFMKKFMGLSNFERSTSLEVSGRPQQILKEWLTVSRMSFQVQMSFSPPSYWDHVSVLCWRASDLEHSPSWRSLQTSTGCVRRLPSVNGCIWVCLSADIGSRDYKWKIILCMIQKMQVLVLNRWFLSVHNCISIRPWESCFSPTQGFRIWTSVSWVCEAGL